MLGLLQAVRHNRMEQLPRGMEIVTQDGMAIDESESVSPQISQYWGLGRVISAEYPGLRCRLIDVDDVDASLSSLVDYMLNDSHENQIALRAGKPYVPRLVPTKAAPVQGEFSVDPEGCYLITGGLGMLGRQAAKWLARRGARDVIVVSRREPTESTRDIIAEIEQQGCRVHVMLADISKRSDVSELFARIDQELPPLKGLIHASGVLDDGLMAEQNWSRFESVLAPKQTGSLLLHEMTADRELDFFILYSSAASVLGSPGQGNYATANAFLDGLAHQRVAAGLPALSINWGPWTEGMAASETVVRSLALQGLTALTSDESHQVMEQLIVSGAVQATVLDVDWRRLRQRLSAFALPVLDLVAPDVAPGGGDSELVETLRAADEAERTELMTTHVRNQLQEILSLPQPPELETPLAELGLDSLMAVELSTRLQQQLEPEITVSPTIAFDYPSAGALTGHLLSLLKELPEVIKPVSVTVKTDDDDVAIIGLGCRFPGAGNAAEFWQNLCHGVDAIRELPSDRWDVDKYYSPTPAPGKMYTREGGFLDSIGDFDADFFGISAQEACWIDPQHRLLMEVSWEALEDAGIVPNQPGGSNVGVFMGIMSQDYAQLDVDDEAGIIDGFRGGGLSHSAGVGRLSFMFGFEGPSYAIDSASSSSLVAVCQAAKSLLENECEMALAGGVNAILTPTNSLLLCKGGLLSPDGRCKSFSAAADGFGRGEGCGVIVLKRRRDAERDGDRILAVIRGSAVAHNGTSGALTAPSGRSQERVIRQALENAKLNAADIDYLEAHGTGTELGDTIEMGAAATVLGQGRGADNPLLVGSVKANIGHLEAAGGISGLIKTVLSMQHGMIPRQLHFDQPSEHIAWDRIPIKMVTEPTPWPNEQKRTAGVSALGMCGTNAHVILESTVINDTPEANELQPRSHHLLVLNAKSASRLGHVAKQYGDWFEASADVDLADACHTAAVGRRHWEQRAAVVVNSAEQATQALRLIQRGAQAAGVACGTAHKSPRLAWMFSGEGSEFVGMGETLYRGEPVFRQAVDYYDDQLWQDQAGSLTEAMFRDEQLLADWRQPALFVLQAALTRLWQSWGVEPDVVLGDGLGQYAAACAAGVMTWEDGFRLVVQRSRALGDQLQPAARQLAGVGVDDADGTVEQTASSVPGISTAKIEAFEQFADTLDYFPANIPLVCNLSGDVVPVHKLLGGSYWSRHLTEPILLAKCMQTLAKQDCQVAVEIGPASALSQNAAAQWLEQGPPVVPSLRRGENEWECMLQGLAELYVAGVNPDFVAYDRPWPREKIQLPSYPFDRKRYWITDVSQYRNEQ
jgi:acyl transferase domain-containing protein